MGVSTSTVAGNGSFTVTLGFRPTKIMWYTLDPVSVSWGCVFNPDMSPNTMSYSGSSISTSTKSSIDDLAQISVSDTGFTWKNTYSSATKGKIYWCAVK